MIITKNIIVGSIIILINLIPILFKKYKYIGITAIISLLLAFLTTLL